MQEVARFPGVHTDDEKRRYLVLKYISQVGPQKRNLQGLQNETTLCHGPLAILVWQGLLRLWNVG